MKEAKEIRYAYWGGSTIMILEGVVWLTAGLVSAHVSEKIGMLLLLFVGMLFYPLGVLMQRILRRPKVSPKNSLRFLVTLASLVIPFSLPLVFMASLQNTNLFFPALSIVTGAHFLPFVYFYGMKSYWILASLLVLNGSYCGFFMNQHMELSVYLTGFILVAFSLVLLILTKREFSRMNM